MNEEVSMAQPIFAATPVKRIKNCIACNKSTSGHVRMLQNIALRSIFKDILSVLDVKLPDDLSNIFICDTCLSTVEKIREMRKKCKENVENLSVECREKRVILHSVSPKAKRAPLSDTCNKVTMGNRNKRQGKKLIFSPLALPAPADKKLVPPAQISDHDYGRIDKQSLNVEEIFAKHHPMSNITSSEASDPDVMETVRSITSSDSAIELKYYINKLLTIPEVERTVWQSYMCQINYEMDRLCGTKDKSVLREKVEEMAPKSFIDSIVKEMDMRCPKVLDILVSLCTPLHMKLPPTNLAVASMYSIAQNSRNNHMNSFQKQIAAACIRYGAGNGLFDILSRMGMCLPEKSKLPLLNTISCMNGTGVIEALKNGRTIKVTVDNIDGRIKASQVRIGSGNRDYHYTHWSVLVDRVMPIDLPELSRQPKRIPLNGPDHQLFYLSSDEHVALRKAYTWLVEKFLVEEFTSLNIFKVADVLQHPYRDIMDRPSLVHPMFVKSLKMWLSFHWVVTSSHG